MSPEVAASLDLPPQRAPDRESLTRSLAAIAALGNRYPGSDGEARARAWLLEAFRGLGLEDVHEEPFAYLGYAPVAAECELAGEGPVGPCVGLQYTADGTVEAEAVYLGRGSESEIDDSRRAGLDLRGRVAVVHGGLVHTVVPGLIAAGAAAIVNIGEVQGGHPGHFTARFYPPPAGRPWADQVAEIPGVCLEAEAGLRLLHSLANGRRRLRVGHRARYLERETANVVGRRPGLDPGRAQVVVGAHHDTQLAGVGAADNATGLSALLEIARMLRSRSLLRTVAYVAFGAEELAAWGAYAYVLAHLSDQPGMAAMVNLDALGAPLDATRTLVADPAIARLADESARATGWEPEAAVVAGAFPYADHIPFVDAGIPACWLWRYPPNHPYYHSAGDVLRHVDLTRLVEDTAAAAAVAGRLAGLDADPGPARPTPRSGELRRRARSRTD